MGPGQCAAGADPHGHCGGHRRWCPRAVGQRGAATRRGSPVGIGLPDGPISQPLRGAFHAEPGTGARRAAGDGCDEGGFWRAHQRMDRG